MIEKKFRKAKGLQIEFHRNTEAVVQKTAKDPQILRRFYPQLGPARILTFGSAPPLKKR